MCHTDKKLMLKRAFLQNKDKPVTIDADDFDDSSREATGNNFSCQFHLCSAFHCTLPGHHWAQYMNYESVIYYKTK